MIDAQWEATSSNNYTNNHASITESYAWIDAYAQKLAADYRDSELIADTVEAYRNLARVQWATVYAQPLFHQHPGAQIVLVQHCDQYIVVDRDGDNDEFWFLVRELDEWLPRLLERGKVVVTDWQTAQATC